MINYLLWKEEWEGQEGQSHWDFHQALNINQAELNLKAVIQHKHRGERKASESSKVPN